MSTTVTYQEGVDGYTGSTSVGFASSTFQSTSYVAHYHRWGDELIRRHPIEHFDLGDLSSYGAVISAKLYLYNIGGNVFTEADIHVRQILDPDDLGGAYATGWEVGEGFRAGANRESRDDTTSPDTKWQNSDPDTPEDLGADYFIPILKSIAGSNSYRPVSSDTTDEIYEIDVTADVADMKSGATPNQGWCLYAQDAANIQDVTATSIYTTDVTKHPKLEIVFEDGGGEFLGRQYPQGVKRGVMRGVV